MAWLVGDSSGRHRVTWPEPNTRALKAKARASPGPCFGDVLLVVS
jgi:hypothetical protein